MQTLSEQAIIEAIRNGETVDAILPCQSMTVRIKEYVPYFCTAIHAGHNINSDLQDNCLLSEAERLQEEDPFTDRLIEPFPIVLIANKSRYEYDLNRSPQACIYENAWGKKVWREPLSERQTQRALAEHSQYYRILQALIAYLEKQFGGCLLLDLHSYNWQIRPYDYAPVFNIGTYNIDKKRWQSNINTLRNSLVGMELSNVDVQVECDTVFQGKGYQGEFVSTHFQNTLAVPLEIKKIYMDEINGEPFPLILDQLSHGLYLSVLATAEQFNRKLKRSKLKHKDLQTSNIEPVVLAVDKALFRLAKGIETLHYVNPVNIRQEKKRFFAQREYNPQFKYRQLRLDPYEFREKLYKLPVSQIQDPLIRGLYRSVVDSYATKVEMLTTVGTPQFLYNSLRYYGEPSIKDINNARFLLHASEFANAEFDNEQINIDDAKLIFEQAAKDYGLQCKIVISNRIVSKAMVDNARKTLMINRNGSFNRFEINALIHHELGVHMVTTNNALAQPLRVFGLGLPGNTYTQEGLAILSEYLSGNLNLTRLKQLSLRVLAVDMMVKGESFSEVFSRLRSEYYMLPDEAFSMTLRVFRGGGFTKDHLYLKGFRDLVSLYRSRNILPLLIGKTDTNSLDTLESLLARGILNQPSYLTPALANNLYQENPVLDYLVTSIN